MIRRLRSRTLFPSSFSPPGKVGREARERTCERHPGVSDGLSSRAERVADTPTAKELQITTMPISEKMPCRPGRANAGEAPPGIAGDRRWSPIPFLQEVVAGS